MEMPPVVFAFGIYLTVVCIKIRQMSVDNKALTPGPQDQDRAPSPPWLTARAFCATSVTPDRLVPATIDSRANWYAGAFTTSVLGARCRPRAKCISLSDRERQSTRRQ